MACARNTNSALLPAFLLPVTFRGAPCVSQHQGSTLSEPLGSRLKLPFGQKERKMSQRTSPLTEDKPVTVKLRQVSLRFRI